MMESVLDNVTATPAEAASPVGGGGYLAWVSQVSVILYAMLCAVILVGNTLLLVAVARLRRSTEKMASSGVVHRMAGPVRHMAWADLLLGLVIPYLVAVMLRPDIMHSLVACRSLVFLFSTPLNFSVYLYLLTAVDGFLASRNGDHKTTSRPLLAMGAAIFTWVLSLANASASASFIEWNPSTGCVYETSTNAAYLTAHSTLLLALLALATGLTLLRGTTTSPAELPLGTMLVWFLATWVPNCVYTIVTVNSDVSAHLELVIAARMLLNVLVYANSAARPFVVARHDAALCREVCRLLCCRRSAEPDSSGFARLQNGI